MRKDADHSARWLAAVHFKNSISKFWRSRAPGAITDDEKTHLRVKLILLLDQEDNQIAVQTAVVLAKVARLDFPKAWPSLFTDLLGRLQAASATPDSSGTLTSRRCYLALHHTLKELSTKRLAPDQRTFSEVSAQLLDPLWTQWGVDTNTLVTGLPAAMSSSSTNGNNNGSQLLLLVFERWLLQLKALRRMLLFGFPSDARTMVPVAAVEQAAPAMLHTLKTLLSLVPQGTAAPRNLAAAMLARGCLKLMKTLRQLSETHPWSVLRCGALVQALELCCVQIYTPSIRSAQVASAVTRQCLQFLHSALRCASYRGSTAALSLTAGKGREQMQQLKDLAAEAAPLLHSFWATKQQPLLDLLVTRMFPFTNAELELWDDSAEEFHQEMEHSAWEESIRGCAERVFVALLEADRVQLAPVVMGMLQRATVGTLNGTTTTTISTTATIRAKTAVYHAVTVGAYELHEFIDFSAWLHASLLHEAADAAPQMRPLRRATIKLIAAWASKLKPEDRPAVYRVVVSALADADPAIHLAAVAALHAMVDDWEFDESQFKEFVPVCFQLLASILQEVSELETQIEIFSFINLIIDRLGEGAAVYAPGLLTLLPAIWAAAEGQSLLRIQIMVALQRLIHALGSASPSTYPVLLPVLSVAADPTQRDELNLLEDGLLLWLVALHHAPTYHPGLLAPLPHLLAIMEHSTEHIAVGGRLLLSCIYLNAGEVLAAHGARIAALLAGFIGNVKDRGMLCLLPIMDLIIQLFPAEGPSLLAAPLQLLLSVVLSRKESKMVVASALGVLARVLLHNPPAFLHLFQTAAAATGGAHLLEDAAMNTNNQIILSSDPAHRLLLATLDVWLDAFDGISSPPSRKLSALALCALLAAPVPEGLQRCTAIAACSTAVWFELEGPEVGPDKMGADYLASYAAPRFDDLPLAVSLADAEGEEERRRAVFDASLVATVRLGAFCKQQMEAAVGVHGGGALNEALNGMDPILGGHLQEMLQ